MKKSLIVAGVASFAVAALPVVGAFAATSSSFVDTINVTVEGGCTMENGSTTGTGVYDDRSFTGSVAAGTAKELNAVSSGTRPGATLTIECNTNTGKSWTISATASNGGALKLQGGSDLIESGYAVSGATSSWAMQSNATGVAQANDLWRTYAGVPTVANTTVLSGVDTDNVTFNPSYHIYVAPDQAPGTYEGTVTYSIVMAP